MSGYVFSSRVNELTPPHIDWSVSGDIVNSDFLSTRQLRLPKHSIALSDTTRQGVLPLNFNFSLIPMT